MKLFNFRNLAMTGALSVAGLGMIGVGAHAVFTQDTTSAQSITAGTMNVTLNSATATAGWNTPNLTLATANAFESSSFAEVSNVTITNNGNIPVSEVALKISDVNNNADMQGALWACIYSDGELLVNEPLTTIEGYGSAVVGGSIAAGGTDSYSVVIYAGTTDGGCGAAFTGFSGGAYTSNEPYSGTPAFGTNPAALSLDNGAQGGTVIPTLTVSYTG
ncbi:MAG TPA: SipW-dependent-type signal peptide-containing protein [Acidimicrobiales bacterium]|nr:SipW-dependent-type signal peptide-containing protein [Acidimicrobiales bacterium]